jgi:hypothetical protein
MRKIYAVSLIILFVMIMVNSCSFFCKKGEGNVIIKKVLLSDFEEMDIDGQAQVFIKPGNSDSLEISIDSNLVEYVKAEVSGKKLKIHESRCIESITEYKIYITTKKLSKLYVAGSVKVKCDSIIKSEELYIKNKGTGDIQLNLDVNNLNLEVGGSGALRLTGRALDMDVEIDDAGSLEAFGLQAKNADVQVKGAGSAKIYVSEKFNGDAGGSGNILYKGNPKKVNTDVTGSGIIQSK